MVSQSWIIDSPKLYEISDKVIKFIEKATKNWKVDLTAGGKSIVEVEIKRGIF